MTAVEALVDGLGGEVTLPSRPDPALDPYLDAAEAAVERYGWAKLSPTDIARTTGVDRTTVYRRLGSKHDILALVVARNVHRLIDHAVASAAEQPPGPEAILEIVASGVEFARSAPALTALLSDDDPELLAGFLTAGTQAVIDRFVDALAAPVASAMEAGLIARRDPHMLVDWGVRMGLSLFAHPPRRALRPFLRELLLPMLTPAPTEDTC